LLVLFYIMIDLAYLLHYTILLLAHVISYTLDHAASELEELTKQAQAEDFAKLVLDQGKS
jgi:hypothetical protein